MKSLSLYALLQVLSLGFCWTWFAGLWAIAFFLYGLGDFEWWLLVITACAGLYGLRPNLERAIDAAWLKGIENTKALQERVALLRPIKRRIDLVFSMVVVVLIVLVAVLGFTGVVGGITT